MAKLERKEEEKEEEDKKEDEEEECFKPQPSNRAVLCPDVLPPLLYYSFRRFNQDTEFSRTMSHLTHYQENPKVFMDQDGTLKLSRVLCL